MSLCKYSDLFGEPDTGVHQYRIFNIAIVDVIATLMVALVLYKFNPKIEYWIYLVGLFIISIILHRLFCVRTTVDILLFS